MMFRFAASVYSVPSPVLAVAKFHPYVCDKRA
jgi:hypothetical protein